MRTEEKTWKYIELYAGSHPDISIEKPIYIESKKYLEKSKEYFEKKDYKAAVVYARTAFEDSLKKFSEKHNVRIKYKKDQRQLQAEDFWDARQA